MLRERVARFLSDPAGDDFDALALATLELQYHRVPAFRALCDARGWTPSAEGDWRQAPPVPTLAFKTLPLHVATPRELFRSSGTTGARRSVHGNPFPELYQEAIDRSFPRFCLPGLDRPPMLALVASRQQLPDSSLSFMVERVLQRFGGEGSAHAFGERGVDVPAARSWIAAHQRQRRPVVVLATSLALAQLLDALERRYLHFRLAAGSVVLHTGGTKGRQLEVAPERLLARVEEYLGVPTAQVVAEYGMTELSSQCYSANLLGGSGELLVPPHWLRVRVLHPESLAEQPPGREGLLAFLDLANLGSVAHVLTEDVGALGDGGFRLAGRAREAELRGCSLTVEELAAASPGEPAPPR